MTLIYYMGHRICGGRAVPVLQVAKADPATLSWNWFLPISGWAHKHGIKELKVWKPSWWHLGSKGKIWARQQLLCRVNKQSLDCARPVFNSDTKWQWEVTARVAWWDVAIILTGSITSRTGSFLNYKRPLKLWWIQEGAVVFLLMSKKLGK